jgi:hypothetical protein
VKILVLCLILVLLNGCVFIYNCTDSEISIDDKDTPTTTTSATGIPL